MVGHKYGSLSVNTGNFYKGTHMAHALYNAAALLPSVVGRQDPNRMERYERDLTGDGSYTPRELRFIYECIRDPESYKGPFTTTIAPDLLPAATEAVRYFTNTALEVVGKDHATGRMVVRSRGQS